jgi:arylsulfatase A-like enzyme
MAVQAWRAFYALCTHIDHQLRLVLGTLREEGLLDDTIILFTSDHGDMLGSHGCWAKRLFYEPSARVPLILLGRAGDARLPVGRVDERLVGLQDVMPTLLDLAGVPVPKTVTGMSLVRRRSRSWLYGESGEGVDATRMIRQGPWKLIYYPEGNQFQLFHVATDPDELNELSPEPRHRGVLDELRSRLRAELYGDDLTWVRGRSWRGLPRRPAGTVLAALRERGRHLVQQRGSHWPPPNVH